jgi:hypothetical protein
MKTLAAAGVIGILTSCLFAQGLSTTAHKDDWEEINFEFNSAVLSDGYPSLLRLAELLREHRDYRVLVTGHTDFVGSAGYNEKLALARATTVRDFLVKYGAIEGQVSVAGDGKRHPVATNETKEGRFINRRVVLTVTDAQGKIIVAAGGANEAIRGIDELFKKQEDCCARILKRLDKLDDILAAIGDLKGENAKLKGELADLRSQQQAIKEQVAGLPKPLTARETTEIAKKEGTDAAQSVVGALPKGHPKFTLLGLNIGPNYGTGKPGDFNFSGRGQFFSPFGASGMRAVQAQAEYMYSPDRQEGQFDIGLVNRFGHVQAGLFSSFKYLAMRQQQSGGSLMQGAFVLDYIFGRGKIGLFGTKGFKNEAILGQTQLGPSAFLQSYVRVVDQVGASGQVGLFGKSYLEGNLAYLKLRSRNDRPGGTLRFVQPVNSVFAVTAEVGYNETFVNSFDSGRVAFGLQFGNFARPIEYKNITTPVPMDVPRVRYEMLTRRIGNSPPVADAGPDQIGVAAGAITLNGSASYDPDGDPITYLWTQVSGPKVSLSGVTTAVATFQAAQGQSYSFRLTVKDTGGMQASARVAVTTAQPPPALAMRILQFSATPNIVTPGQPSRLQWVVENADSVSIAPAPGTVDAKSGTADVTPVQTTTYTLTARGASGTLTATATVQIQTTPPTSPMIIRFEANPVTILPGESSTLSWTTQGTASASISGIGAVDPNGSRAVTPAQTTTYTLTAIGSDGRQVTAPVTVVVATVQVPSVLQFVASPSTVDLGSSSKLCWQVTGATSIDIPGVGAGVKANDCATVSPTSTTTYTLTARNAAGQIQANATVTVGLIKILTFTSDPLTSLAAGAPVVLSWTTLGAISVTITGNDVSTISQPPNGSMTIHPITNSTYTLTAFGPGGQQTVAVIAVFVR